MRNLTPNTRFIISHPRTSSSTIRDDSGLSFQTSTFHISVYITLAVTNSGSAHTLTDCDYYEDGTRTVATPTSAFGDARWTTECVTNVQAVTSDTTVTAPLRSLPLNGKELHSHQWK